MFLARKIAALVTKRPVLTLIVSFLPSITALVALLSTSAVSIATPTLTSFLPRSSPQTHFYLARLAAKRLYTVPVPQTLQLKLHRAKLSSKKSVALLVGPLNVTLESIRRISALEDIITKGEWRRMCRFDAFAPKCRGECAEVLSVLNSPHLYGIRNEADEFCSRKTDVTREGVEVFKESLGKLSSDSPTLATRRGDLFMFLSLFQVGEPFEDFNSTDDQGDAQFKFYESWVDKVAREISMASTKDVPSVLLGTELAQLRVRQQTSRDLVFAVPAISLVFGIVWFHTTSFFLASIAMLQIFSSFPLAYIIYTYVLRQLYFSALQIFAVFLLLGIGADDVFVFTDAWKQAPVEIQDTELRRRVEWTYNRAGKAMFCTTMTTAVAFAVTAASPIMPLSTFGVWAAVLILVQFLMVIMVYPCALVLWQRHFRKRAFRFCIRDSDVEKNCISTSCLSALRREKRPEDGQTRLLEQFFQGPWARIVSILKIPLVIVSVALITVCVVVSMRLQPPREDAQFLANDDPITIGRKIVKNEFQSVQNARWYVTVTWGIRNIDHSSTSRYEPDSPGGVLIDESFDLKLEATQRHIFNFCKQIRNNAQLSSASASDSSQVSCWIEDFSRWKSEKARPQFETYESDASLMYDVVNFALWRNSDNKQPFMHYLVDQTIMLSTDLKRVVSCEISILSPNRSDIPYVAMGRVYEDWQVKLSEINSIGPSTANKAFATGGDAWVYQAIQQTLVQSMVRNLSIMVSVALVVLSMTTLNIGVAFIACLCLAGIISSLIGLIYLFGWSLGLTESVTISMATGYSFDGIAHIAMAYSQSAKRDRFSRTQDALGTLGISVVFGALSTLCSSAALLPASILVFSQLAKLVIIAISLTVFWSLVLLPAYLMLVGPQADFLSLRPLLRCVSLTNKSDSAKATPERSICSIETSVAAGNGVEQSAEENSPR